MSSDLNVPLCTKCSKINHLDSKRHLLRNVLIIPADLPCASSPATPVLNSGIERPEKAFWLYAGSIVDFEFRLDTLERERENANKIEQKKETLTIRHHFLRHCFSLFSLRLFSLFSFSFTQINRHGQLPDGPAILSHGPTTMHR